MPSAQRNASIDLQERFQMLETQVKGIYELLQPSSASTSGPGPSPSASASVPSTGFQAEYSASPSMISPPQIDGSFNMHNPDIPSEVLDHLIDIYRVKLHLQPLQLFTLPELKDSLISGPRYLLDSFLALTVRYSTHDFFRDQQAKAVEYYASSAQHEVTVLASHGIPKLEIVQALCLLVLVDVTTCKPGRAWMSIGTMSRLEGLRKLSHNSFYESSPELDISLRCHWTVALLEQTFMPQERSSVQDDDEQKYPTSACRPPSLPPVNDGECPPDLFSDDASEDLGITAYYINVIEIWGHLSTYMHQVRIGKAETAWAPGSMHYILCAELYKHDTRLPHSHLLRKVHFTKRLAVELQEQREYWIPWLLMQVVSHAITAILHHPFIHLVAMRDKSSGLQARSFLQQTVDQALYHSSWVFKLLRFCEENRFEIFDPLVGQLVAVVATIPWLFQLAIDTKVAEKAKDDLDWCKGFLERLSATWPHISQKLELLQSLDSIADNTSQPPTGKGISIAFHPSLFWALVDPKISQMTPLQSECSSGPQNSMIRISTHYIHPLNDTQTGQSVPHQGEESFDPFLFDVGDLEEVNLDGILTHFMPDIIASLHHLIMDQTSKIVIIGAGLFGLTTAKQLALEGHQNITVIDRHMPPVPDGSSSDISRVIRFDYADTDYCSLAYEAYRKWSQDPKYKGIFYQTDYIIAGSRSTPEKSWTDKTIAQLDKRQLPYTRLANADDTKQKFPILTGELAQPNFEGYWNKSGGWADASKAIKQLRDECLELGISFIAGRAGTVIGFDSDAQGVVKAAKTVEGTPVRGDHFILAAGAWSSGIVPTYNSTLSTAQAIGYLRLTDDEMIKYKNLPIYMNYATGWFNFPPHEDTKMLKFAVHGWGYTRAPSEGDNNSVKSNISVPPPVSRERKNFVPEDAEERLRAGLREMLPELADRALDRVALCWYTDTPTGDFIMDYHPDYKNLFIGGGGSGHAFKFLPVLGKCMTTAIKKTLPSHLAEKWKFHTEYEHRKDAFIGDGSRGGPERRELSAAEKARLDGEQRSKL
ncbi:hypothetical protein FBEOM_4826 [Fusarium beomiforme]|uniref:FAD dependent oxidoreductase domain-containing protein n=1 Tax=Fusarium beomiforme TaxID=44412 RepID=A0A9P5AMG6_9HYPO|nr:hypothetical protein FBEOM_4826 [Fusarium beomiforme]